MIGGGSDMVMCAAEEVAQRKRKKNIGVASQECRIAIAIEFDEIETTNVLYERMWDVGMPC